MALDPQPPAPVARITPQHEAARVARPVAAARAAPDCRSVVRRGGVRPRRNRPHPRHPRGHRAVRGVPRAPPAACITGGLEGAVAMTYEPMPFDHRPDAVLGAALRQALDPG